MTTPADHFAALSEVQRDLAVRRYRVWMQRLAPASPISFRDPVDIDEYGSVTVGDWGGYLVQILPMIFNDRLVLTPQHCPYVVDVGWCYDKGPAALMAARIWDPETQAEPVGFKKRVGGPRQAGQRAMSEAEGIAASARMEALMEFWKSHS